LPFVIAGVADLDGVRPHCKSGGGERGDTVDQCRGDDVLARIDKRDGADRRSIASSQGRAQRDCLAECGGVGGDCQLDSCRLVREDIQNRTCGLAGSIERVTVEDGDGSVNAGREGARGEGRGIGHERQGSDDLIGWKADEIEEIDRADGLTAGGYFRNGECDRNTGLDVTRRGGGKVSGCLQRRSNYLGVVQENLGGVLAVLSGYEVIETVAIKVGEDGCGVTPGRSRESFEQRSGREESAVAFAGEDEECVSPIGGDDIGSPVAVDVSDGYGVEVGQVSGRCGVLRRE